LRGISAKAGEWEAGSAATLYSTKPVVRNQAENSDTRQ